jgi:hypothetical protein
MVKRRKKSLFETIETNDIPQFLGDNASSAHGKSFQNFSMQKEKNPFTITLCK